jgi:hypothetical protein
MCQATKENSLSQYEGLLKKGDVSFSLERKTRSRLDVTSASEGAGLGRKVKSNKSRWRAGDLLVEAEREVPSPFYDGTLSRLYALSSRCPRIGCLDAWWEVKNSWLPYSLFTSAWPGLFVGTEGILSVWNTTLMVLSLVHCSNLRKRQDGIGPDMDDKITSDRGWVKKKGKTDNLSMFVYRTRLDMFGTQR